jgi:hypothetical protein
VFENSLGPDNLVFVFVDSDPIWIQINVLTHRVRLEIFEDLA